jgi:mRNA-degrading endonuclease RelE of RelBE toxin-antitoxin system
MFPVFVHEDAVAVLDQLTARQERKLQEWKGRLQSDPMVGQQVQHARIPRTLQRRYAVTNLWRLPLPGGWRLLYTVLVQEKDRGILVLWIGTHKEYDRLFGYRTS